MYVSDIPSCFLSSYLLKDVDDIKIPHMVKRQSWFALAVFVCNPELEELGGAKLKSRNELSMIEWLHGEKLKIDSNRATKATTFEEETRADKRHSRQEVAVRKSVKELYEIEQKYITQNRTKIWAAFRETIQRIEYQGDWIQLNRIYLAIITTYWISNV